MVPDHATLVDRVTSVIARTQKLAPETVAIDKSFEELNIDSLDGINILFALEGEFDIDIPDDSARTIRSIREMVDGVEQLLIQKQERASQQAAAAVPADGSEDPKVP
jgi:acyl carrier protein